MANDKKFGLKGILAILVLLVVGGLLASFMNAAIYSLAIAGILLIVVSQTDYAKSLGAGKDKNRQLLAILGIFLLAVPFVPQLSGVQGIYDSTIGGFLGGMGGVPAVVQAPRAAEIAGQQPASQGTSVITTTSTLSIVAKNMLNKSEEKLNPGGQYLYGGAYQSLSFSSGKATITSLDPFAKIDKVSVGTVAWSRN